MFLSDLSIKRPVLTTCVMLALVVLGLFSIKGLGLDSFPKIDLPVEYGGEAIEIGFNPIYLMDALKVADQETVTFAKWLDGREPTP